MTSIDDLIRQGLSRDNYAEDVSSFRADTVSAVITPDGYLAMDVKLDFVVSRKDEDRILESIRSEIPNLKGVRVRHIYMRESMATKPDETARIYAGRCLAALPTIVKNAADPGRINAEGDKVTIRVVGGASLDEINRVWSKRISDRIEEKFGLSYSVSFERDDEARKEAEERITLSDEELSRIALKDAENAVPAGPETVSGDAQGGAPSGGYSGGHESGGSGYTGPRRRGSRNI